MISNTTVKLFRGNIVLLNIILVVLLAESKTVKGIVTDLKNGNQPIPGVLVSFDHTLFRTFTDSSGIFSFDIPEIGIGKSAPDKIVSDQNLVYNQRIGSILLPAAGILSEFALYNLDGREIIKKKIGKNDIRIIVPKISSGLFIVRLTFTDGGKFCGTILCTSVSNLQRLSFKLYDNDTKRSGTLLNDHKIIFRHDNYFPLDRSSIGLGDTLLVGMKRDPRAGFFDDTKVHTMRFTISNQDSILMERNAVDEQYVPAEMAYNETSIGSVGIRYKGSQYSLQRCIDDNGIRNSYDDCDNISLKIKFNEYNDTARFFSMKKLNLHSMSYDDSKMKEMFAYKLFREMGIYTCRTVFVKIYVNNVYRGLFTAVETIDGRFTKSRWPEFGNGNLYKEVWPWKSGVAYYNNGLETNTNPGDSIWTVRMPNMAQAIKNSTPENFKTNINPFMDLDYFVNYIVVDRTIHNSDGIMAWYYEKSWQGNHNYFFYEEENKGGKAWIIPWDLNATLYPEDMVIDEYDIPDWNEAPDSCQPVLTWGGSNILPPNCIKLINLTAESCWDQFKLAGKYYLDHIFIKEKMRAYLKKLKELIAPAMENDPWTTKVEWEQNISYFDASIDKLYSGFDDHINGRKQSVDSSSFHKETDPDSGFSAAYCNNFEFNKPFSTINWIFTEASVNSTVTVVIDTLAPSWGKKSLKVQFVYYPAEDTSKQYAEWSYIGLKFKQVSDLSAFDSIRICLQSDVPRGYRITLQSYLYDTLKAQNIRYGWEDWVTRKNKQFSFAIENACVPDWVDTTDPGILDTILTAITGIGISVQPQYESNGKLRIVPDSGMVRIDNIEFIKKKQ